MSIIANSSAKVVVQGITGREGRFHTEQCLSYGTDIVAGVTPGKGGSLVLNVPVYDTMAEVVSLTGANTSLLFVPPAQCADAILEAVDSGIKLIVCITEGLPVHDMLLIKNYLKTTDCILLGPNCPGIITPGACKIGIIPSTICTPGSIGVVSRSGTLTYEVISQLSSQGLGQSTCVGIGGDPVIGTDFISCLKGFEEDDQTKGIVMVGEIGGRAEEDAAVYIRDHVHKPVIGFIAGLTAPPGKRMGHAGAIIESGSGLASDKINSFKKSGITVCENLWELGILAARTFKRSPS